MATKTSQRRIANRQTAEIGRWYTSTIDGETQGRVISADCRVTLVQMSGDRIDECRGEEFADSWE